jgi:hypothetical protein
MDLVVAIFIIDQFRLKIPQNRVRRCLRSILGWVLKNETAFDQPFTLMMDLHRLATNPFVQPRLSLNRLVAFSHDHLARLTANNPGGLFAARIAATEAALAQVAGSAAADETKLALRKARKQAKRQFRAALPGGIGKIYGALLAQFGAKSVELKECFPAGRNVFLKCRDAVLAEELAALGNGLADFQKQLGATPAAQAAALLAGWQAVFDPSETATGNKVAAMMDKRAARAALQLELFKNLLTIVMNYPASRSW